MKLSDALIKTLEHEGVTHIFALPGEEIEGILFSLRDSSIKLITCRHEQGAAFMADVWGRLTGKAGVCLATLGPGATNLITGLADAHMDKAPVVALTGQADMKRMHKESHQYVDVVGMLRPITKWNLSLHDAAILPEVVRKAFKLAQIEKPGVTHIEIPEDIATQEVAYEPLPVRRVRRGAPDHQAIDAALELIRQAKKPMILAGNGAIRKRASTHLQQFVGSTCIPFVCTFMGKGAVSDRSPYSLRTVGVQSRDYPIYALAESDLIITVGFDIAELYPVTLQMINADKKKKIIHIDFEPAEIDTYYDPTVEIVADISATLWELNRRIQEAHLKCSTTPWWRPYQDAQKVHHDSYKLSPSEALTTPGTLHILREVMADDAIVISDVGSHKAWIGRNLPIYTSGTCIISNGFASMGIAVPGAIAAKLACPAQQVVALTGDGGFLMNSQELETAKRTGVAFTLIILNDNNYGLITWKQETHTGTSHGTALANPDFVAYAHSFGIRAHHPKNSDELKKTLAECVRSKEIEVVIVDIDPSVNGALTAHLKKTLF